MGVFRFSMVAVLVAVSACQPAPSNPEPRGGQSLALCAREAGIAGPYSIEIVQVNGRWIEEVLAGPGVSPVQASRANACLDRRQSV